jgi:hypothetical protein
MRGGGERNVSSAAELVIRLRCAQHENAVRNPKSGSRKHNPLVRIKKTLRTLPIFSTEHVSPLLALQMSTGAFRQGEIWL